MIKKYFYKNNFFSKFFHCQDNQFYEEMNQMTLNSSSSLPSPPKSVPPLPNKDQQNKTNSHEIEDDGSK